MSVSVNGAARYAVVFRLGSEAPMAGALVIGDESLTLDGRRPGARESQTVPYSELAAVRVGRTVEERLNGRPTLVLERTDNPSIQIEPLGFGFLHELASLLTAFAIRNGAADETVGVIIPLKEGRLERARELVAQGPPFDPEALGLTCHEVFLNEDEATFVFHGPRARVTLQGVSRDPSLWRAGLAWRSCIGGRPRFVDASELTVTDDERPVFSWTAAR